MTSGQQNTIGLQSIKLLQVKLFTITKYKLLLPGKLWWKVLCFTCRFVVYYTDRIVFLSLVFHSLNMFRCAYLQNCA